MTQPAERVRALLRVTADHLPGGPIDVPLPDLVARARTPRPHRRGLVAAAFLLVLLVVAVPVILLGRPGPDRVPLPGYRVATVDAYPTAGPAGASALARGRWTRLPAAPIAGRVAAATVWTGGEMLVWGGETSDGGRGFADGAAYDPGVIRWQVLPAGPLTARSHMAYAWTGGQLFVWGGYVWVDGERKVAADGALYDPGSHAWRPVAASPLTARANAIALWTGGQVVVLSGEPAIRTDAGPYLDAAAYDPATDEWRRLPAIPAERSKPAMYVTAAATPDGIDVWSFWEHRQATSDGYESTAGVSLHRYDPRSMAWRAVDAAQPNDLGAPLWTGHELVFPAAPLFHGGGSGPPGMNLAGWRLDTSTGGWRRIAHGPVDDLRATSIWTGAALLTVNSQTTVTDPDGTTTYPGAAAAWDPGTERWSRLPGAPYVGAEGIGTVWTGSRLLMWGLMRPRTDTGAEESEGGLTFGP